MRRAWGTSIFRLLTAGFCLACSAAVVDRIAVIVGKDVITESEVLRDVRITQFLNGQPLDLGPQARRAAADRLVDQQLIRNEMDLGHYPEPPAAEANAMLARFQQEHYHDMAQLQAALAQYGLTEDELKRFFLWEAAVVRFTQQRFLSPVTAPPQGANEAGGPAEKPAASPSQGQQLDTWLKEARANTHIEFKPEAFQ